MSRQFIDDIAPEAFSEAFVAIAVPAFNEAKTIGACIQALDVAAGGVVGTSVHLVVLVNNSKDATAKIARAYRPTVLRITVVEVTLSGEHAHAGGARRAAFEHALPLFPPDCVLMTTDADSCVDPRWISANLAELSKGVDAVAGVVTFDRDTLDALPTMPMRALEWELARLQARLSTLIDPRPHDPWPNHIWAWGASLALTASAYRQIGGLPSIPLAEDRALAEAIEMADLRLRHSHAPVVYTSARQTGRAPGGFADLLNRYQVDDLAPCDAALEPTTALIRRLAWRSRLRRTADLNGLRCAAELARRIGYDGEAACSFGKLWKAVETQSLLLQRMRVDPAMLVIEVAFAHRIINRIERRVKDQVDNRESANV